MLGIIAAGLLLLQSAGAQTRFTYSKGQSVSPSYEGWMPNEDGSFTLYFGYMNTNWLEEFDIPVGPLAEPRRGGPVRSSPPARGRREGGGEDPRPRRGRPGRHRVLPRGRARDDRPRPPLHRPRQR